MSAPELTAPAVWNPARTPRGTVVLLTGRGEHPGVYDRLGTRLTVDGYAVVAPQPDAGDAAVLAALDAAPGPRFLIGSDTGALRAWSLALAPGSRPDGLILAALPLTTTGGDAPADRETEIEARSACPIFREKLESDGDFRWGELGAAVDAAPEALPDVPVLLLHGDADAIAPADAVRAIARETDDLAVVAGGVHDVLNDKYHRIVAARIVLFLERIATDSHFVVPAAPESPKASRRSTPLHVSARLDYALRALAELVEAGGATVTCDAVARSRDIPLNSLVNIMLTLRRAELVESRRGCEGGYRLARPAETITIADVVRATEGGIATVRADGVTAPLWADLERTVTEFLSERNLNTTGATP